MLVTCDVSASDKHSCHMHGAAAAAHGILLGLFSMLQGIARSAIRD